MESSGEGDSGSAEQFRTGKKRKKKKQAAGIDAPFRVLAGAAAATLEL